MNNVTVQQATFTLLSPFDTLVASGAAEGGETPG
jgi:hypothetical protein